MGAYSVRRILSLIPTLFGLSVVVLLLMHLVPGTVVEQVLGSDAAADTTARAALRAFFGLDQPFHVQYWRWLTGVLHGDLGRSFRTAQPVLNIIAPKLMVSVELALLTTLVTVAVGVPLGIWAAVRHGTWPDGLLRIFSLLGLSTPVFWQGSMMILLLSLAFRWMPPVIYTPFNKGPLINLTIMCLPALALGTASSSVVMRMTRSSFLEILSQDYVRTARAKGLREKAVLNRHALRNALIPVVTVVGLQFGQILGGVVVVEEVFALPGLGRGVLQALFERDYPVVQAAVLIIAALLMLLNLSVDLMYGIFDPRIRYS
jgi:peptide/nickel transport system permease protein